MRDIAVTSRTAWMLVLLASLAPSVAAENEAEYLYRNCKTYHSDWMSQKICKVHLEGHIEFILEDCAKVAERGECPRICLPPQVRSDIVLLRDVFIEYADGHPEEFNWAYTNEIHIKMLANALASRWPCR